MTDEQITKILLEYLLPYEESGELQWWGKEEQLLKFARMIYNKGRTDEIMQQPKMCYVNDQLIVSD